MHDVSFHGPCSQISQRVDIDYSAAKAAKLADPSEAIRERRMQSADTQMMHSYGQRWIIGGQFSHVKASHTAVQFVWRAISFESNIPGKGRQNLLRFPLGESCHAFAENIFSH